MEGFLTFIAINTKVSIYVCSTICCSIISNFSCSINIRSCWSFPLLLYTCLFLDDVAFFLLEDTIIVIISGNTSTTRNNRPCDAILTTTIHMVSRLGIGSKINSVL